MNPSQMHPQICFITNLAPHYREAIFTKMDNELGCDFFIGDRVDTQIETMDYQALSGFKKTLTYIPLFGKLYWQKGTLGLPFRHYKQYLMTLEFQCLSTWYLLIMLKLLGKRSLLWTHGWYGDEIRVKKKIKKFLFRFSDKILLYGEHARNLMIGEGIAPEKLECIYNSLNYDNQVKIRLTLQPATIYHDHFSNLDPVLLFIGRLQTSKKTELLVRAVHRLNKEGRGCNLVIIGDETEDSGIRLLVDELGLNDRTWFTGPLYDETKLAELIYNADVAVSPGNVGLSAIHCLTYGTPVITHDNFVNQMPEFEAIDPGKTGSFFIEDSLEDLCLKIESWIDLSPEKRESIRKECYSVISEKYTPRYQIELLNRLLIDSTVR